MIHGIYTIPIALNDGASAPMKAHGDEDAAFDLYANEDSWVEACETTRIPTGVHVEIPEGCAGLVLPRSDLALRYGITFPNAPGLIDPGYRGEIQVPVYLLPTEGDIRAIANGTDPRHHLFKRGDRIAQLLIVPTLPVVFTRSNSLSERGVV